MDVAWENWGSWPGFAFCTEFDELPRFLNEYLWQQKLDGVHVMASALDLRTRGGHYPNHGLRLRDGREVPSGYVLDGEVVGVGHFSDVRPAIEKQRYSEVTFVPFDVVRAAHVDLTAVQTRRRLEFLESLVGAENVLAQLTEDEVRGEVEAKRWEGLIAKRANWRYPTGRTSAWLKWKHSYLLVATVMGIEEGKNGRAGAAGAVRFGVVVKGKLTEVGTAGGLTGREAAEMWAHPEKYVGQQCHIKHYGLQKSKLRNPIYRGLV